MNLVDFLLGACATLALLYGADALQAAWRHHRHARRTP
jgi:hypothetical protein